MYYKVTILFLVFILLLFVTFKKLKTSNKKKAQNMDHNFIKHIYIVSH